MASFWPSSIINKGDLIGLKTSIANIGDLTPKAKGKV